MDEMLNKFLLQSLKKSVSNPDLLEVMDWAVLPAGKLFRPRLVLALAEDLGSINNNHYHLGCAVELHHAYTLVHDDLPAMDNDLIRRGKASTHAQFGEWKAILAGDALLIASFGELMRITHPRQTSVHKLFSWATGARGLILGQFLDLGAKGTASLEDVVRIHELKTARLIQVCTLGAYLLSEKKQSLRSTIEFLRLGREIGVSFQLLDDLGELVETSISSHELEINPFLTTTAGAMAELEASLKRLRRLLQEHDLKHLNQFLDDYFAKTKEKLVSGKMNLDRHLKRPSDQIIGMV